MRTSSDFLPPKATTSRINLLSLLIYSASFDTTCPTPLSRKAKLT